MGRYCSCSGAAACPVKTPLEMRKNSWIPSPQMFQKLTWPKTRRHLGHVVRFVRFIPATTATISSMEPFVCKTKKIHRDVGAVRTLTFQVGDYRWPDGREYRGTSDPKFAKPLSDSKRIFWNGFLLPQIRVPSGNISVTKVERRLYARLWHIPILFSGRWQGAKMFAKSLRFGVFRLNLSLVFCEKNDTFASASWASRWTASLHLVPWSRTRPRMKMNGWGPFYYVISILLLTINNQGFYFVQYFINTRDLYNYLLSHSAPPSIKKTNSCGVVSLWRGQKSLSAGIWCPMRLVHSAWVVWYLNVSCMACMKALNNSLRHVYTMSICGLETLDDIWQTAV